MGRIEGRPSYLQFTVEKLASDVAEVTSIAGQLEGIEQKVSDIESLRKHGFTDKIDEVKRHLEFAAEMLGKCAGVASRASELYEQAERKVLARYEGKELGADGPEVIRGEDGFIDRVGEAWCGPTSGTVACSLASGSKDLVDAKYFGLTGEYGVLEMEGGAKTSRTDGQGQATFKDDLSAARGGLGVRGGTKDNNVHLGIKGNILHANVEGDANLSAKKGEGGGGVKGSLSGNLADAEVTAGFTVGGTDYDLTVGAGLGTGYSGEAEVSPKEDGESAYGATVGPVSFRLSKKKAGSSK